MSEVEPYRSLASTRSAGCEYCFVESEFAVERLLASSLEVLDILTTPSVAERLRPAADAAGVPLIVRRAAEIRTTVGFAFHRGCIARARRPARVAPPSLRTANALVLDRITDPVNVGAIIRTARAFGVGHVITTAGTGDPYERRAIRASMGHVFSLHLHVELSLDEACTWLGRQRSEGLTVIGTDLGGRPLRSAAASRPSCVVLGNEGHGLSPQLRAVCDETVTISMEPGVDSLNVAAAAAIVLHWQHQSHTGTPGANS